MEPSHDRRVLRSFPFLGIDIYLELPEFWAEVYNKLLDVVWVDDVVLLKFRL